MGECWRMIKLFNRDMGSLGPSDMHAQLVILNKKTLGKVMHADGEFGILCFKAFWSPLKRLSDRTMERNIFSALRDHFKILILIEETWSLSSPGWKSVSGMRFCSLECIRHSYPWLHPQWIPFNPEDNVCIYFPRALKLGAKFQHLYCKPISFVQMKSMLMTLQDCK